MIPLDPQDFCFLWGQLLYEVEEEVKILFYTFKENPVGHSNFHMQLDAQIDEENVSVVSHTLVNCCILLRCSVFHQDFPFVTEADGMPPSLNVLALISGLWDFCLSVHFTAEECQFDCVTKVKHLIRETNGGRAH